MKSKGMKMQRGIRKPTYTQIRNEMAKNVKERKPTKGKVMTPLPITPELKKKLENRMFDKPTLPKKEDRSKRKEMIPLYKGGKVKK